MSRPGEARVSPLRTPFEQSIGGPEDPKVAVAGGHLYVIWSEGLSGGHAQMARYDRPGAPPVWHRAAPAGAGDRPGIDAYPGAGGGADAVEIGGDGKSWFVRPDTGAVIGLRAGRDGGGGAIVWASGGHAYLDENGYIRVADLSTGAITQTVSATADIDATTSGTLIDNGGNAITAYRLY